MVDYIDANAFVDFAHFKLNPNFTGDSVKWNPDIIKQNSIVFVKKGLVNMFFNNVLHSTNKHILITHLADDPITKDEFNRKPGCVVKWYAENALYDNVDLIPIPIGLENKTGICQEHFKGKRDWFVENLERLRNKPKNAEEVYCNWTTNNNTSTRANIVNLLKTNYKHLEGLTYQNYYETMSDYKFIIAPSGNCDGDTHRVWEALYMNCFPIVIKHNIFKEYKDNDLPIIQVNNWSEVTPEFLQESLNKTYNYEKLYMSYWKKRLIDEFNKL